MSPAASAARLREPHELPGPRGWPWLGNLPQVRPAHVHRQVEAWAREHGPLFRFRFGARRFVGVADHALIAQVLRDRPDGFRRTERLEAIGREMGLAPGVFGSNGEEWRRQRRLVMAGFDPAHVRAYYPHLQAVAGRLRARWAHAARAGRALALQPELMRFTVDAITGLAFGQDVRSLDGDDDVIQRHLDRIFPALFRRIIAPLPVWRWWPSAADRELARSVAAVDAAIAGFIAQARQRLHDEPSRRERPPNLLEAMLAAASTPGAEFDDADVKGNVLNMLLAGEDTTANTLAWMIHLLALNPALLRQAQDEVRALAGAAPAVPLEQLDALRFVEACMHETMRLKPVAPFNVLQALRETVVGDLRVPPGTLVWCVLRHDSLQPAHFAAPHDFRPQRWVDAADARADAPGGGAPMGAGHASPGAAAASAKRVSMPFGAGPRICPGRYLAMVEMKLVMATLLGRFDIVSVSAPGGAEAAERMAFTMAPVGLSLRLRERDGAAPH